MPAVAVAGSLREILQDPQILFVGAGREAEGKILDPLGYSREAISSGGVKGKGVIGKAKGLSSSVRGLFQALGIMRRFKPDLVFGAGGYVSGPIGLAARILGIPLVIHEQNRRPGLTNRLLGRAAETVFLGDALASSYFPKGRTIVSGNPVRRQILALGDQDKDENAGQGGEGRDGPFTLLISGGSQGARSINLAVMGMIDEMAKSPRRIKVIHQAGAEGEGMLRPAYERSGLDFELKAFVQDMERPLSMASLAVSRAGALTLSELAAARLPAILIPLPTAADDHQTENARTLEEAGAAVVLPEGSLSPKALWALVESMMDTKGRLSEMRANAKKIKVGDSALLIARHIKGILEKRGAAPKGEKASGR
jgi:UDP-N-acetylglucosamine--N-acetylmuramyl-(pentapeptide) pyrophosphoryl-undecaprenol N-acetylglucosamine transferase